VRAGVIAAGWGRRLGPGAKALAKVGGRTLIDHVLDGLEAVRVERVVCIVNDAAAPAVMRATGRARPFGIEWVVQTTPSSMHSFLAVSSRLAESGDEWFLVSTVDAVAPPDVFRLFAAVAATSSDADLVLGLTDLIDDERPLHVRVAKRQSGPAPPMPPAPDRGPYRVEAIGDAAKDSPIVTAGLYLARPSILRATASALDAKLGALRQFFAHALDSGLRLDGVLLPPVVDVDRPEDVAAAERMLRERCSGAAVQRSPRKGGTNA
jgi:NDP-sugar pyrophosphorylase family protein